MSVITGVALFIFGLLNLASVVTDIVRRVKAGTSESREPAGVYRRARHDAEASRPNGPAIRRR
jgi:hypothetical protein